MGHRFHGIGDQPDLGWHSHSLAWSVDGLYVMVNAWWEPLTFTMQTGGQWRVVLSTAPAAFDGVTCVVAPRSVVVLERA